MSLVWFFAHVTHSRWKIGGYLIKRYLATEPAKKVFQIPLKTGHWRVWAILLVLLINVNNQFQDICTRSLRWNIFSWPLPCSFGIFALLCFFFWEKAVLHCYSFSHFMFMLLLTEVNCNTLFYQYSFNTHNICYLWTMATWNDICMHTYQEQYEVLCKWKVNRLHYHPQYFSALDL